MYKRVFLILILITTLLPQSHSQQDEKPYIPPPLEVRVWTNLASGQPLLQTHVSPSAMKLRFHDFYKNCDGQCFYHLGDPLSPSTSQCDLQKKNCSMIASIARHGGHACNRAVTDSNFRLNFPTLCTTTNLGPDEPQFYTISLIRELKNNPISCAVTAGSGVVIPRPYYLQFRAHCVPTEFVGISLQSTNSTVPGPINDQFKWFVCIAGESWISYWDKAASPSPAQIFGSVPFSQGAPGVIHYESSWDSETRTFACRFIIAANLFQQNNDSLRDVDLPVNKAEHVSVKVKMAKGLVTRVEVAPPWTLLMPPKRDLTSKERKDESKYFELYGRLVHPNFVLQPNQPNDTFDTLAVDSFISTSNDTANFTELVVESRQFYNASSEEEKDDMADFIKGEFLVCQYGGNRATIVNGRVQNIHCLEPNEQASCITSRKCPVLVAIRELETYLEIAIVSYNPAKTSLTRFGVSEKNVVRPKGWAAFAFSRDRKMGDDLAVACVTHGEDETNIVVGWNEGYNFYQDDTLNQDLIFDREKVMFTRQKSGDTILCRFKMNWTVTVNVSGYDRGGRSGGNPEILKEFDLRPGQTWNILLAKGSHIYRGGHISYHAHFREVVNRLFKAGQYSRAKGSAPSGIYGLIMLLRTLMLLFTI